MTVNIRATVKRPLALDIEQLKAKFIKVQRAPSLVTAVDDARLEWRRTLDEFNLVDIEMIDYIIFKINAAERRYMLLLDQAKKENAAAW